ncbi:hypothetical protein NQ317_009680 [Molorchus minor]|uniref:Uncharacterized protein n=1 Tax=Molorchus minor TaxID=1323400 RepID=A0ABQ9JHP9_9CUCU|nr:hypothetical protein NQ317_009680 [Molorchus minor]
MSPYYSSNFEVKYASKRWYINITEGLEDKILKNNSELVVTLIATETASGNEGYSALVLELPSTDNNTSPEFSSAYYLADYPKDGKGFLELEDPIQFLNGDLPEQISITLDSYPDNFEVVYDQDTWKINIKNSIDQDILNKNNELVMTLIATESGYESKGYSALVIKLPSEKDGTSIEFTEAYYLAKYPEDGNGTIELKNPISFLNVEDPETVTISLDKYSENFQILYTSNKWVINIMKNINESILNKNAELLMTLTATDSADNTVDYSALVLELPTGSNGSGPIFSDAYYIAEYTEDANDIIEFDNAIGFENVDDPSKISIQLDNYTSYFDILLSSGKWYIQIVTPLDESVLKENAELIATLIATDDENKQGYAALVLKLPIADYIVTDNKGNVAFTDAINITNKDDLSKIKISVDNYQENFNLTYDSGKNTWVMNVLKQISDDILISKTDIVIGLTATDTTNNLTSHTVVDLTLPAIDNLSAPKFSKTYYTARYSFNGDTPVVTLDTP